MKKKLSKKQLAVINDIFKGEMDEQAILDKHKVSRNLYERWLADDKFNERFEARIDSEYRQSRVLLARCATAAAAKLVQLTDCEKEETARRACLDIIRPSQNSLNYNSPAQQPRQLNTPQISPETASKLLAVLAETQQSDENI